jgi:hypothetical protein
MLQLRIFEPTKKTQVSRGPTSKQCPLGV